MQRPALCTVVIAALAAIGCASGQAVPRPFPGAPTPPPSEAPAVTGDQPVAIAPPAVTEAPTPEPPWSMALVSTALSFRGVPYRNGGADPAGFDCSGFVRYVFAQFGQQLPREVQAQFRVGRVVDRNDVRAGDLVFFQTVSPGASHVGIAVGNGEFVHAPSSRGVVRTERYTIEYWARRWIGARRLG
jgi:cell wall-associated NlpC family hydrolase